ncbi:hypothetical protein [Streptomyces mangrovisoli]|uniref:Uncharacterized protein n=1 Tax=Streptomyces mangrovisoli TaxID=1428628 RepID=A0A1J4P0K9_9ACTN|nr:hypothetical protein [Streptomyces mangrovisoli]OIJ68136.1 hypothetical protein WN71_010145 [Streptomyces mangrovisoli]
MDRHGDLAEATVRLWHDEPSGVRMTEAETAALTEELAGLAVHRVTPLPAGPAPAGTRSAEAWETAALVITLRAAPTLVRSLVALLQDWLRRRNSGSIELKLGAHELRLTSTGRAAQREAIEGFFTAIEQDRDAARAVESGDHG